MKLGLRKIFVLCLCVIFCWLINATCSFCQDIMNGICNGANNIGAQNRPLIVFDCSSDSFDRFGKPNFCSAHICDGCGACNNNLLYKPLNYRSFHYNNNNNNVMNYYCFNNNYNYCLGYGGNSNNIDDIGLCYCKSVLSKAVCQYKYMINYYDYQRDRNFTKFFSEYLVKDDKDGMLKIDDIYGNVLDRYSLFKKEGEVFTIVNQQEVLDRFYSYMMHACFFSSDFDVKFNGNGQSFAHHLVVKYSLDSIKNISLDPYFVLSRRDPMKCEDGAIVYDNDDDISPPVSVLNDPNCKKMYFLKLENVGANSDCSVCNIKKFSCFSEQNGGVKKNKYLMKYVAVLLDFRVREAKRDMNLMDNHLFYPQVLKEGNNKDVFKEEFYWKFKRHNIKESLSNYINSYGVGFFSVLAVLGILSAAIFLPLYIFHGNSVSDVVIPNIDSAAIDNISHTVPVVPVHHHMTRIDKFVYVFNKLFSYVGWVAAFVGVYYHHLYRFIGDRLNKHFCIAAVLSSVSMFGYGIGLFGLDAFIIHNLISLGIFFRFANNNHKTVLAKYSVLYLAAASVFSLFFPNPWCLFVLSMMSCFAAYIGYGLSNNQDIEILKGHGRSFSIIFGALSIICWIFGFGHPMSDLYGLIFSISVGCYSGFGDIGVKYLRYIFGGIGLLSMMWWSAGLIGWGWLLMSCIPSISLECYMNWGSNMIIVSRVVSTVLPILSIFGWYYGELNPLISLLIICLPIGVLYNFDDEFNKFIKDKKEFIKYFDPVLLSPIVAALWYFHLVNIVYGVLFLCALAIVYKILDKKFGTVEFLEDKFSSFRDIKDSLCEQFVNSNLMFLGFVPIFLFGWYFHSWVMFVAGLSILYHIKGMSLDEIKKKIVYLYNKKIDSIPESWRPLLSKFINYIDNTKGADEDCDNGSDVHIKITRDSKADYSSLNRLLLDNYDNPIIALMSKLSYNSSCNEDFMNSVVNVLDSNKIVVDRSVGSRLTKLQRALWEVMFINLYSKLKASTLIDKLRFFVYCFEWAGYSMNNAINYVRMRKVSGTLGEFDYHCNSIKLRDYIDGKKDEEYEILLWSAFEAYVFQHCTVVLHGLDNALDQNKKDELGGLIETLQDDIANEKVKGKGVDSLCKCVDMIFSMIKREQFAIFKFNEDKLLADLFKVLYISDSTLVKECKKIDDEKWKGIISTITAKWA